MGQIYAVRTALQGIIAPLTDKVYYEQADEGALYPHIVYVIREYGYEDERYTCDIVADVYDNERDTFALEALADSMQEALDHRVILTDEVMIHSYLSTRQPVTEAEKRIKHRRLTFALYYYWRKCHE